MILNQMKKLSIEIFILLVVSSFVVFFQFNQVPKKLSWDEVEFTRLALSLEGERYTSFSQLATGHSTLYFYIILGSIKLFGLSNFALRFPSAFFGILNILLFYFICRIVFFRLHYFKKHFLNYRFLPFLLSFILLTSRWYFNFARFSFEATFLLFLELAAIYFFLKYFQKSFWQPDTIRYPGVQNRTSKQRFRASRNNPIAYLLLTAFFSGLAFHSYYPGRIFFLLPFLFIIFYSGKRLIKRNALIFASVFLIAASPLVIYLLSHPDLRIKEQLFLTDKKLDLQTKLSYFAENITKLTGMFTFSGDLNGRHNYPGKAHFNPAIGALFLFGAAVSIFKVKNFFNQFFLTYFLLSLLPALFTYPAGNPNSLRTFTVLAPSVYFIGNGLIYLFQSEQKSNKFLLLTIISLIFLIILSSLYDLRTYFRYQKIVFNKSFELNGSIRRILNLRLWEKIQTL